MRLLLMAILIVSCSTLSTAASWEDYSLSVVTLSSGVPVSLFCSPDGEGRRLDAASVFGASGATTDATIRLELLDWNGLPVAGMPAEDIWLDFAGEELAFCDGGAIADAPTDADGRTTFSGSLPAGGHRAHGDPVRVEVWVLWNRLPSDLSELAMNSSDLDGDLDVDLADVIRFAEIWRAHGYDYAVDFHYDGLVNLADLVVFADHLNTTCP